MKILKNSFKSTEHIQKKNMGEVSAPLASSVLALEAREKPLVIS